MVPLLTAVTASLSILMFLLWYMRSKNQMEARIRSLTEQQRMVTEYQDPFAQRVAFPVVAGLVNAVMVFMPTTLVSRAQRWLITGGEKMTVSQFFTIVLISSTLLPVGYFVLVWVATSGSPSPLALSPVLLFLVIGMVLPFMVLRRIAKNRQKQIWRSLPNAIDLLTTCVEAGHSLDFALQRVAERYKGGLSEEIQRTIREMGMGKTRRQALADMAERIDVPDVATFVNSIVQAETLGTSVGQVLRAQAVQMRQRRRQRAEQIARQAPVKMVFPLVLFLMPSLFIVTLGPVVLSVLETFSES